MIPKEAIAELAELFDRFNNAFDPNSDDAQRAEDQFHAKLYALHTAHAAGIDFRVFRYDVISRCRQFLCKNKP